MSVKLPGNVFFFAAGNGELRLSAARISDLQHPEEICTARRTIESTVELVLKLRTSNYRLNRIEINRIELLRVGPSVFQDFHVNTICTDGPGACAASRIARRARPPRLHDADSAPHLVRRWLHLCCEFCRTNREVKQDRTFHESSSSHVQPPLDRHARQNINSNRLRARRHVSTSRGQRLKRIFGTAYPLGQPRNPLKKPPLDTRPTY
jgi:hypothetical protein